LLLTDGQDGTKIAQVKASIEKHDLVGAVPIHTLAFGADHNAELLRQIAEETLGTYSFIETAESVSDAVAPALAGMLSMVAKSTSITVSTISATVKMVETGAYKSKLEAGKAIIQAGDCYDGENRKFLLSLVLDNLPAEVTASYSYKDPLADQVREGNISLELRAGGADEVKSNSEVSEFKLNVLFKNALKAALLEAGKNRHAEARKLLEDLLVEVQNYPISIAEDAKAALVADINTNLDNMKTLGSNGDGASGRAAFADMNAYQGEMQVQRAGLNAMKKSSYNRAKFSTRAQEKCSEKASDYWNSNSKS